MDNIKVSVIVTTYNWPDALSKVLAALLSQDYSNFEIVVADDGSSSSTTDVIKKMHSTKILHVWQENEGFQAGKIRNKAVASAKGDYLIFIDGDCIPQKTFIKRHLQLAELGWLVAGNRILLSQRFTQKVLSENLPIQNWNYKKWLFSRIRKNCNRVLPLIFLPFFPRRLQPLRWQGVKTCNLSLWRKDFIAVNGFDEAYVGWGYEDSDLIIRLIRNGIKTKNGRFAVPVIHLWHKEADRSLENVNLSRLETQLKSQESWVQTGVNQYLGISE